MLGLSALALLIAVPQAGDAPRPSNTMTAFVNVSVLPMDRKRVLAGQTVLVQDGRIAALGPAGKVTVPASAVRVDGRGQFLIPGLADMHVHILDSTPAALAQFLAHGVTTVRNMYAGGVIPFPLSVREQVRSGALLGPTIYAASPKIDGHDWEPAALVAAVARYKAAGYDLIKMYNPELTLEALDSFVAAARRAGLPFGGHVPRGEVTLARWLEARPITIDHLEGYWREWQKPYSGFQPFKQAMESIETGAVRLDDSALAAAAVATTRAGVWNVPTLTVFQKVNFGMSPELHQRFLKVRGRIVRALRDAGAGLLVGTDDPGSAEQRSEVEYGANVHTELQLLVATGLTPYQALEAGTRNVALALGTQEQTGTIAVGKRADVVLLRGNPLRDIRNTTKIAGVMVGGRWLPRAALDRLLTEARAQINKQGP